MYVLLYAKRVTHLRCFYISTLSGILQPDKHLLVQRRKRIGKRKKHVQSQQYRHQEQRLNDVVFLLFLLLTLNIVHTFFKCFHC